MNFKRFFGGTLLACAALFLPSCDYVNINYPAPVIAAISPSTVVAGSPTFTLTVTGSSFVPGSTILFNGAALVTLYASNTKLTAMVPFQDIATPGQAQISVTTPQPGGGTSLTLNLIVKGGTSPIPVVTSISPTTATAGSSSLTLHVYGNSFVSSSAITINGLTQSTTLVTGNQSSQAQELTAVIPDSDLLNGGTIDVGVLNPQPGGGESNVIQMLVNNPVPVITSLSPTSAAAGTGTQAITIAGAGFVPTSVVALNGNPRATLFSSSTQVSVSLAGGDLGFAGVDQITVINPQPGGGSSQPSVFSVNPSGTTGVGLPELVDVALNGAQANNGINMPTRTSMVISSNGQSVAFSSPSNNLVANDTNGASDVFVHSTCMNSSSCTQSNVLGSLAAGGNQGNADALDPSMDSSGKFVAFTSTATNLDPNFPTVNGQTRQVYVHQVSTSTSSSSSTITESTYLVSAAADGVNPADADAFSPAVSSDGRYVAFLSAATNLVANSVGNGLVQVYMRDTCSGQVTTTCTPITYLISSPDGVTPANASSSEPFVSSGGEFVSFTSAASNIIAGVVPAPSQTQIYDHTTCLTTTTTGCTVENALVSSPDGLVPADGASSQSNMTTDGRYFVFSSTATDLINGVDSGIQQIYLEDTCAGFTSTTSTTCSRTLLLISTPDITTTPTTPSNQLSEYATVSSKGQYIAFASRATNLVPGTNNGFENIFVRSTCLNFTPTGTTPATTTCTPSTVLRSVSASGALGNGDSRFPAISSDGHSVMFYSAASNLVPNDTNGLENVFLGSTTF
jgi:trimeric autotransporter adhesin